MHSSTDVMASQGFAMKRSNAAIQAAGLVFEAFDYVAARATAIARGYVEARRRNKAMIETISLLSHLDDHQLRDIGVERGQIVGIARRAAE